MWGMSWMTEGMSLPTVAASWMLILATASGAVGGLLAGALPAKLPGRRSRIALVCAGVSLCIWTVALVRGIVAPFGFIGCDSARSFALHSR